MVNRVALPPLDWFELQICPQEFRLAVVPGQPMLIGVRRSSAEEPATWLFPRTATYAESIDAVTRRLQRIIATSGVLANKMPGADRTFSPEWLKSPSLHLRMGFGSHRWQGWYALDDLPEHVQALLAACKDLAVRATSGPGTPISGTQALDLVRGHVNDSKN
jgi:hypothetical protein